MQHSQWSYSSFGHDDCNTKTDDDKIVTVVRMPTRDAPRELLSRPQFVGDKNWQVESWITPECESAAASDVPRAMRRNQLPCFRTRMKLSAK